MADETSREPSSLGPGNALVATHGIHPPAPASIDDLTPDWLTSALRVQHPGVTVTGVTATSVRQGSCTTARLVLEYDRAGHRAGLPPTLFAKGDWTGRRSGPTFNEARFYSELAPQLPGVNLPRCLYSSADEREQTGVLLLEDLTARNAILTGAGDAFTPAQARDLAGQLAELHALWFDQSAQAEHPWLRPTGTVVMPTPQDHDEETGIYGTFKQWWWEKRIASGHCDVVPEQLRDRRAVKQAFANLFRLEADTPVCLVHGDPHLGNLFLDREGRPGLYDWIGCLGRWAHDVNYAVVGSLAVEHRRQHEEAILDHYLERLANAGGPQLDRDRAWLSWRRQTIHGLLYMMCSPKQQPEALIAQQTVRFAAAAEDYELLAVLDVE